MAKFYARCVVSPGLFLFVVQCMVQTAAEGATPQPQSQPQSSVSLGPLPESSETNATCYCNAGADCDLVTSLCSSTKTASVHECQVVLTVEKHLEYTCLTSFLTCLHTEPYFCCDGYLNSNCNRCPDLSALGIFYADQLEGLNVLPECNYSLPPRPPTTSPTTQTDSSDGSGSTQRIWLVPVIVLSIILASVVVLGVFVMYYVHSRRCKSADVESIGGPSFEGSTFDYDMSLSCGSGALNGNRQCQTKTLAKLVSLQERIDKGGFGEVWRATWDGREIAIKMFRSISYNDWKREAGIYKTCMLMHPNILSLIGCETHENNYGPDYWLLFYYHHNGNLYSYLRNHTLSQTQGLTFLTSIATGLAYLHLPIFTATGDKKPIIAHRDIKSANVLIKDDLTCCIADLGLGVTEDDFKPKSVEDDALPDHQQGTKRYMAPEVLAGTINRRSVNSYVLADIYAFSLLMWEVARRCSSTCYKHGEVLAYEIPYQNMVPSDPSMEDMKKKVVDEGARPPIDPNWKEDELLSALSRIIQECWCVVPSARPTSTRIKMDLARITLDSKPECK